MSSQRPDRTYHQDYIARIRYSNTLPPPPNPPKLLDIPGTGLSSGDYTSASYGTRLAREQPLNIEADAELGMPIDLVGLPGVFDGNEAAIMARDPPPTLHPHDRALLKPLSHLGRSGALSGGVTFLRKTEYISSDQGIKRFESSTSKDLLKLRNDPKRRKKDNLNREDPVNILKNVIKGFDVAYPGDAFTGEDSTDRVRGAEISAADVNAWSNPKHPKQPGLKVVDSYPVLPDFEALPALGHYLLFKYSTDPSASTKDYNIGLDVAILRPDNPNTIKQEERMAAYETDLKASKPLVEYDYSLYMPDDTEAVRGIKRKFDASNPDNEDESWYTYTDDQGVPSFRYRRVRAYETFQQQGDGDDPFADSVALALHDPETEVADGKKSKMKAAYIYPVSQRTQLRPKRRTKQMLQDPDKEKDITTILVSVRDANEDELSTRQSARAKYDPALASEMAGTEVAMEA